MASKPHISTIRCISCQMSVIACLLNEARHLLPFCLARFLPLSRSRKAGRLNARGPASHLSCFPSFHHSSPASRWQQRPLPSAYGHCSLSTSQRPSCNSRPLAIHLRPGPSPSLPKSHALFRHSDPFAVEEVAHPTANQDQSNASHSQ
ncbi:hypothetical protein BDZ90DRAFT_1017 [Jaminaea rosea]|uniref:Uncharacterized protein n=1 Tax=Jaminaea rosea TaxID=1569628 RepID=A0A316V3A6_9BASI|nr:hypothetical protein BDZ90DRAFT_1017 [Jaminaea rosea]PWN29925.1 hypothetical protein BDZ90DRAFT_1017 [Jaminaea rosea]